VYTIEAMDWNTGRSLFYVPLSSSLLANSLYAATEIGTENDIVMGTLSGILRVALNGIETSPSQIEQALKNWEAMDAMAQQ